MSKTAKCVWVCDRCGSHEHLTTSGDVKWCVEEQEWVVDHVNGDTDWCTNVLCDSDTSSTEIPWPRPDVFLVVSYPNESAYTDVLTGYQHAKSSVYGHLFADDNQLDKEAFLTDGPETFDEIKGRALATHTIGISDAPDKIHDVWRLGPDGKVAGLIQRYTPSKGEQDG